MTVYSTYTGLVIRLISLFHNWCRCDPLSRWFRCLVGSTPTLPIVDFMTGHCHPLFWSLSRAQYVTVTPEYGNHFQIVVTAKSPIVLGSCCALLLDCFILLLKQLVIQLIRLILFRTLVMFFYLFVFPTIHPPNPTRGRRGSLL